MYTSALTYSAQQMLFTGGEKHVRGYRIYQIKVDNGQCTFGRKWLDE